MNVIRLCVFSLLIIAKKCSIRCYRFVCDLIWVFPRTFAYLQRLTLKPSHLLMKSSLEDNKNYEKKKIHENSNLNLSNSMLSLKFWTYFRWKYLWKCLVLVWNCFSFVFSVDSMNHTKQQRLFDTKFTAFKRFFFITKKVLDRVENKSNERRSKTKCVAR